MWEYKSITKFYLSDIEGQCQGHSGFEGLYLVNYAIRNY